MQLFEGGGAGVWDRWLARSRAGVLGDLRLKAAEKVTWLVISSGARNFSMGKNPRKEGFLTPQTPFGMMGR